MLTVTILVNGQPVYTRSARRQSDKIKKVNEYITDSGDVIKHRYNAGIIPLAKAILDTIKSEPLE
jgi:hypothetical protein